MSQNRTVTRGATERQIAAAITFDHVEVVYPGRRRAGPTRALGGVSLSVGDDEVVAIVGPSGCGKSTLLALAAGLLRASSGSAHVAGSTALMPQNDMLLPWRSALANAALALEATGVDRREARRRAAPLFERFGLESFERAMPHELSGGMRQRIAFLRTILTGRPILALDEPFASLDAITRADLQTWLRAALTTAPRTVLLVTHDIDEALVVSDRVAIMSARPGVIVAELDCGRPRELDRIEWTTSREFADLKTAALEALR